MLLIRSDSFSTVWCCELLFSFVALDPVGNVSLSLQIVILFLLVLGLPFFRGPSNRKNFMLHGYSTVIALILHTTLIFLVMVPSFTNGLSELGELSLFDSVTVWSHIILGIVAEALGTILVAVWLRERTSKIGLRKMENMDDACFRHLGKYLLSMERSYIF